ncbi:MAG: zf-HC2 domain-containing protein [Terriglobales bacterium]
MTEVPKIVYDRLRAARPEQALPGRTQSEPAHPDADLLAAFAEQALSATERDNLLQHLALCGDCREMVALALPDAGVVAVPTAAGTETVRATAILVKSQWSWLSSPKFAWPSLRWAALAAGIAVAASVLLLHPGKLNQSMLPSSNRQGAPAAQLAAGPQNASSPIAPSPMEQPTVLAKTAKTDEARLKPGLPMSKKLRTGHSAPPLQGQSGMLLAENKNGSAQADMLPATPSASARAFDSNASISRGVSETVEASGASVAIETESSSLSSPMPRSDAPAIEKAKPALQAEVVGPQKTEAPVAAATRVQGRNVMSSMKLAPSSNQTLAHNVTWAITAGILQRSLDSGQSWQNALRADRPLLCYASHDADIWTGGQAGALFHSSDNGLTWVHVQPSVTTLALSSDVTRIDIRDNVRGPAEIVVFTNNNETWSSADGGQTWEKK